MRSRARRVEVVPPDPQWPVLAKAESDRIAVYLGSNLVRIEHIGSTSIPGLHAKPIIDLLPLVRQIEDVDPLEASLETAGYNWYGEYGLSGRRYLNRDDEAGSTRIANVHIFAIDNPEVDRHLAFRDYLLAHPELVAEYGRMKLKCAAQNPVNIDGYSTCKGPWIKPVEAAAVEWYRARQAVPD
jgi:GrpB-like predicted nucleotidyltransferase (UPF0157 family)